MPFYLCRMVLCLAVLKVRKRVVFPVFVFFNLLFVFTRAVSQNPVLQFKADSVSLGEPVEVLVYYKHKPNIELVFPDSNYHYGQFEFVSKKYFPTATVEGESMDSVLYTLRTFQDSTVYFLRLPVTLFFSKDTIRELSNEDSIFFRPVIVAFSDTLKLRSNTELLPVTREFNYLIAVIGGGIVAIILAIIYLFFGKKLLQVVKRYRMKVSHRNFLKAYDGLLDANELSIKAMENALSLWKKYLQSLEEKPYTTFTSAEIAKNLNKEYLKKNLQSIDAAIYGGRTLSLATEDFAELRRVAISLYQAILHNKGHETK